MHVHVHMRDVFKARLYIISFMRKKVWMYFLVGLLAFCPAMALAGESQILRMGNADVSLFDEGWLFKRYGLQADGTTVNEPTG